MPHRSDPGFRVIHAMRCIGSAGEARVAEAAGLSVEETTTQLGRLAKNGLTELASGPFGGWNLTEKGRTAEAEMVAAELEQTGTRHPVHDCYRRFLELNPTLLQVCSDWQMRRIGPSLVMNDHTDRDYDTKVLIRLMKIDTGVQPICGDLADRLARFGVYQPRFTAAFERVMAGDANWVADNLGSYHAVWFQLHEDLLTTLGISRIEERESAAGN